MATADSWPAVAAHRLRTIDTWATQHPIGVSRPGDYGGETRMAQF